MSALGKTMATYGRLLKFVKPYRVRLAQGIIFGTLYGSTNAAALFVVRKVWARVFEEAGGPLSAWQLAALASLLPLVMLARGLCDFLSTYLMNWVSLRVVMDLRARIFDHLQTLSLDFFSNARTGELISNVTNDVTLVQFSLTTVIEDVLKAPVTLVCVLGYLLYLDWRLTLGAVVLFPLCIVPILIYGRKINKASRASQEEQASLLSVLHEAIAGFRVVKAFGMEQRESQDFRELCRRLFGQRMRIVRSSASTGPIIELLAALGMALVFIYAYHAHLQGSQLVSILLGLMLLYEPVKKISRVHMVIQESIAGADRVFRLLDQQPTVVEQPVAIALPHFRQSLRFEHVAFQYDVAPGGDRRSVLNDVDLEIQAGSLVAIVGPSGAGKTTLLNLVPRFYDPTGGAVKIDGVDIRDVTFKSLRDQIGLVTQETFLFNDTVASNIAYGKPGAAKEEIIAAANRAHAHEFILQMPQQYDTIIGESGVKLSGGQRQRLAIARAILRNPPILLLDEATSALDTESERAVQAALDELMWSDRQKQRHTMLVIAHRLSTVQHADRIIVLDKGRVVEEGAHEQLLASGKTYKRLYDLQFNL
jgi:subfamily B ATP-binding cassette protein MsbA